MIKVSILNIIKNYISLNIKVTVCGWVRTRRDSKAGLSFLSIYDGSCLHSLQTVMNTLLPNYYGEILKLTTGCSVEVVGKIISSPREDQKFELQVNKIKVVGWIQYPNIYPIAAKNHSMEYLREVAHLRPRTKIIGAITRIRHTLAHALHRFFYKNGYFWIPTPIITSLNPEGVGEMFRVSTLHKKYFFGKEAFLTVSGQLNGETYACSLSKIYTFGPTFRAEKSNTSRHLAEFWMIEPEVAFATLNDLILLSEKMLKYIFQAVLDECPDDMNFFVESVQKDSINRMINFLYSPLIQVDYTDAIEILISSEENFENTVFWGISLSSEHERYISEKYFYEPVIIKNYPKKIKAFYMRLNEDNKTVAAMDILAPGIGEIIGGSQREERITILECRIKEMGINKKDYWWYRELRMYGTVPHSGFGVGFERLIAYVTGVKNVRDIIPFPRTLRSTFF